MSATLEFDHEQALAFLADEAEKAGNILAEIRPNARPRWHVVSCFSGAESLAAAHLSARRFGIYMPFIRIKFQDRFGRPSSRPRKFFPGYLFVFVWDILHHYRRIKSCPGVRAIEMKGGEPAVVSDEFISMIQSQEIRLDEVIDLKSLRPRRKKGSRKEALTSEERINDTVIMRPFDAHVDFRKLDDETRIRVLRETVGLRS